MLKIKNKKFRKQEIKQPKFFLSILLFIFFILCILIIIFFLIISNIKINYKKNLFQSQIETLKKQVEDLERKNQELKANISESQTDFFVEKKIREDLGFKKTDEEVVAVIPSTEKKQEKVIETKKNFWQKILYFLNIR